VGRLREGREAPGFDPLLRDLRFAVRAVRRDPGFALVAAVTVALGVGATTAVFTIANAFLFRPLPVPEADRLHTIQERRSGATSSGAEGSRVPYDRYGSYEERTRGVFSGLAAHRGADFALRLDGETLPVDGTLVSGNYFEVLRLTPAAGRFFTEDDVPEIVIGHRLWHERFGGDPGVVGSGVRVDGDLYTVVGVAPEGFLSTTVGDVTALWVPVRSSESRGGFSVWVGMFGRLRPGVTPVEAETVANGVALAVPPASRRARCAALASIP
jgi:hypothetical protein